MSEYANVRVGKLVLKGDKKKGKKRKHKSKEKEVDKTRQEDDKDMLEHGQWWKVKKIEEISGPVALELGKHTYVKALDNGLFTLGAPHADFEGPSPEEILTAVVINERKVAFKSGYGKYLKIEKNGVVTGRSDAIGAMEQWEPVFEDNKLALQSATDCFLSVQESDDAVVAKCKRASEMNFLNIRCQSAKVQVATKSVPEEEQGSLQQVEINYVKKFQKFQDKKLRLNPGDKTALKQAKVEGNFHETMLDRRSKMKADRYCK